MSSTLLEKARGALEEIEALESLAVETMSGKVSGAKASMERDGVLSNVVDGMAKSAEALTLLYADRDGAYREERAIPAASDATLPNEGDNREERAGRARRANLADTLLNGGGEKVETDSTSLASKIEQS